MSTILYTVADLRALEQAAQATLPRGELMRRAGRAAAAIISGGGPSGRPRRAVIVCGPGNNGGDGYVCALELKQRGCEVVCVALAAPATEDARAAGELWSDAGGRTLPGLPADDDVDVVVDALFGIGLARPLAGAGLAAADWINRQPAPVYALDVPSGLDADRGSWVGGVAGVRAKATITFIGAKPGLFTGAGRDAAGSVIVEPIGVGDGSARGSGVLLGPGNFAELLVPRRQDSHKGTFGSVAIVGGNVGMIGAPLLAARAALRLGAGRVYVDCLGAPDLRWDPLQPELMFRPLKGLGALTACVVGCGLGDGPLAQSALAAVLARPEPVVLDADALNLLGADDHLTRACTTRSTTTVLTPHPLEAARLLGIDSAAVQADRIGQAQELARRFNALVVLKGAGSVVAESTGRFGISPTGSAALATAGTGDVLAGMIGALLGQCAEARCAVDAAVWLHGAAADDFQADIGLVASDIAPLAARRLAALRRPR